VKRRTAALAAVLAISAVTLVGCEGKFSEPFKDAKRSGNDNGTPMDVVRMSDGFTNVGTKCDHGNRIYVGYHGDHAYAAIAVVPQDPTC